MEAAFLVSYALLWVLVAFQSLVLLGLARSIGRPSAGDAAASLHGALRGRAAPRFEATDVAGRPFDSLDLAGRFAALLFVSPTCTSCEVTLEELRAVEAKSGGSVVVVCRAGRDECKELAETYGLDVPVLPDPNLEISQAFHVQAVPTAVLVDERNVVKTYGFPMRAQELVQIVDRARDEEREKVT